MNFPQITMHSTYGQIEINTQNASLSSEQPPADLNIEQPKAEMIINRTPPWLTIDQSRARADVDLKSARQRIEEAAQQGHQSAAEGIARRAQEGEELMKIENGGGVIAQQAKQRRIVPEHEFGIGWVPSVGSVKFDYNPGQLDINWNIHKPVINSQSYQPIINFNPGNINISMKQYPSLNIDISL